VELFLQTETLIIELLLVVSLIALIARRLRIPYTVALVVVGLLLSLQQFIHVTLTPELILALLVPPLVFEAAFHLNLGELRRNMAPILVLAVPGVLLTTLVVGGIVSAGVNMALPLALLFGALIAATDPVSVVALFRAVGVPKRLSVLVEGESLFNDGTAIVLFQILLAVALGGQLGVAGATIEFIRVSAGGILVGLALGWLVSLLIARIDDYLIETALTAALAFGSFLVADRLNVSGVLAVVAAGLINGNLGPRGMSPTSRIVIINFWEFVAFLANSFVFLLIGLDTNFSLLASGWQAILWAVIAVLLARAVVVYGLGGLVSRFSSAPIPMSWQHVLNWGGLRGAISLALALSLPAELGAAGGLLRTMTFGVVLFSLLVQATTMRPLVKRLGIVTRTSEQVEYEMRHARLTALRAAARHLENLHNQGLVSTHTFDRLMPAVGQEIDARVGALRAAIRSVPEVEAEELDTALRELLRAQRSALAGLRHDGVLSDEAFELLVADLDARLASGEFDVAVDGSELEDARSDETREAPVGSGPA
jgi:CPA1 family monovalent cation:H+ antiporter